jgi:uncharacterized protein (DUF362 family)
MEIESIMNRREFLKATTVITAGLLSQKNLLYASNATNLIRDNVIAKVSTGTPREMVQKAVELVGGMSRFIKKGSVVVVKPNIGWARRPEQAANTNPEVVAEVVKLCFQAGAAKVKVFDSTCNEAKQCYLLSGIEKAAKQEGAEVRYIFPQKFKSVTVPTGKVLKSWEFYDDALGADVFINVPIIKHHSLAKISMGLKNMMGILGGNRGEIHNNFDQKIVDLNTVVRPHLTILDGTRMLMRNGPQGGNLNDVKEMNTIIAGTDPVGVDAMGAELFGLSPTGLTYLQKANEMGLGEIDLKKLTIKGMNG